MADSRLGSGLAKAFATGVGRTARSAGSGARRAAQAQPKRSRRSRAAVGPNPGVNDSVSQLRVQHSDGLAEKDADRRSAQPPIAVGAGGSISGRVGWVGFMLHRRGGPEVALSVSIRRV